MAVPPPPALRVALSRAYYLGLSEYRVEFPFSIDSKRTIVNGAVSPNPGHQLKYGIGFGRIDREVTDLLARNRAGDHRLIRPTD